jgi:hypothetical protein
MAHNDFQAGPYTQRNRINPEATAAAADPGSNMGEENTELGSSGVLTIGRVLSYYGGLQGYRVSTPTRGPRMACAIPDVLNVMGARAFNPISPNTSVLIWWANQESEIGYIIAVLPRLPVHNWANLGGFIREGAGVGFLYDQVHRKQLGVDNEASEVPLGAPDFNEGRPWDTLAGDWGVINELGVGIAVLKMMASMQAGYAEIGVSFIDQEAYIAGERITIESETTDYRHFNDQGEGSTIRQFTPYAWEGLGAKEPATGELLKELTEDPKSSDEQLSRYAPKDWEQVGIFRFLELEGLLGGLLHQWVICPKDPPEIVKRSTARNWPGLAEINIGEDGFITQRTAKGFLIEKTSIIAVPEERREPWDPQGDKDEACDYGLEALPDAEVDYPWNDTDPTSRGPRIADHNAWRSQVKNLAGIRGHKKDWAVPEESAAAVVSGTVPVTPLGRKFRADMPEGEDVKIDHRRPKVRYRPGRAFIYLGDDGSIHQQDAYGSTFSSAGGNHEFAPRGDFIVRPARRFIVQAPLDAIINGGRNVELAASKGDIRLKAEKNMHLLAGNGGTVGGVLIETRSDDSAGEKNDYTKQGQDTVSTGIMLKSVKAPVVTWGSSVMVQAKNGDIVIDGQEGGKDVSIFGKNVRLFGAESASLSATVKPGQGLSNSDTSPLIRVSAESLTMLCGTAGAAFTEGQMRVLTEVKVLGNVTTTESFFSPDVEIQSFDDSQMNPSASQMKADAKDARKPVKKAVADMQAQVYTGEKAFFNTSLIEKISFSFNNSEQYWTNEGFVLNATYWQVMFGSSTTWDQPEVKFKTSMPTMPWPGKETWEGSSFGQIQKSAFKNYDLETGAAKALPRAVEGAAAPTLVSLKGNYTIDTQG